MGMNNQNLILNKRGKIQNQKTNKKAHKLENQRAAVQFSFSSVAQSCPILFDPMNRSMPGLPVHHQLLEFTQTHVH